MATEAKAVPTRAVLTTKAKAAEEDKPNTPSPHVSWATDEEWQRILTSLRANGL